MKLFHWEVQRSDIKLDRLHRLLNGAKGLTDVFV